MNWCRIVLKNIATDSVKLVSLSNRAFGIPSYLEIDIQDKKIVVISDP